MKIPAAPTDLTTQWLTSALHKGGFGAQIEVTAYDIAPLPDDKGFFSQLARIHLTYGSPAQDAPQSLIAKFSSSTAEMRNRPGTQSAYLCEVRFYQEVASHIELPTPLCYYSDIDPATGLHLLLLEDLAPAQSGTRIQGCSHHQAQLAVHQIAYFHAHWWQNPDLAQFSWLDEPKSSIDAAQLRAKHDEWWPAFYTQAHAQLPDTLRTIGEQLGQHRGWMMRHLWHTSPRTLIHADYQLDNLFFSTPAGGVPFAVVDWQSIKLGRGIWDVALFLGQNLDPELRRAVEMELLTDYHQILVEQGVLGYSFENCLYDYKIALLQRFGALISTIAAMPFTQEQIQMHIDVLLPRNVAAILDHDAGDLLSQRVP